MAELSLRSQMLFLATAEVALYLSYRGHDASFHWATHFLVGAVVALLADSIRTWWTGRPGDALPLAILGWHVIAMFPDLLFQAGIAHRSWMDIFLGHISSHFIPGRNLTWLLLAGAAAVIHRSSGRMAASSHD